MRHEEKSANNSIANSTASQTLADDRGGQRLAESSTSSTVYPPAHIVRHGEGLPVVMLHGNGVDHRLLLPLDDALAAPGDLQRVYLDLPGFGQTPALKAPGGLPELTDWVIATVRDIVGNRPFAVLGNSLGGLLARAVRVEFGDQVVGLALLAPVVNPDESARTTPEFEALEVDEKLLNSLSEGDREAFTEMAVLQTPDTWERFRTSALPGINVVDKDALTTLMDRYDLADDRLEPAGVDLSSGTTALCITARQDHIVGFADQWNLVQDSYPRASFAVLDRAGHNVHVDQFGQVNALVAEWGVTLSSLQG